MWYMYGSVCTYMNVCELSVVAQAVLILSPSLFLFPFFPSLSSFLFSPPLLSGVFLPSLTLSLLPSFLPLPFPLPPSPPSLSLGLIVCVQVHVL